MTNEAKLVSHWNALHEKHEALEKEIDQAYKTHERDETIRAIKIKKLKIKDEMQHIEQQLGIR